MGGIWVGLPSILCCVYWQPVLKEKCKKPSGWIAKGWGGGVNNYNMLGNDMKQFLNSFATQRGREIDRKALVLKARHKLRRLFSTQGYFNKKSMKKLREK